MKRILVTACGHQGGYDLCTFLKGKGYYVIGTDINPYCAGRFYCDEFYMGDCLVEYDFKLITSSHEIKWFDKHQVYEMLHDKIPLPQYIYSEKYVVKPVLGSGAKGVEYLETDKMVMEYMEGENIDVDVVSEGKELLIAIPKLRRRAYGGTLVEGEIVDRPYIVEQIEEALRVLPLNGLSCWQFIDGKLLEINPRIAGAVADYEIVDLWIKYSLGEIEKEELKKYQPNYRQEIIRCIQTVNQNLKQ